MYTTNLEFLVAWLFLSKAFQDGTNSATFKIYVFVIGAYVGAKIIIGLLMSVPCCHGLTDYCYRWSVVRLGKWMHQVLLAAAFWLTKSCLLLSHCNPISFANIFWHLVYIEGEQLCWERHAWKTFWLHQVILWDFESQCCDFFLPKLNSD